MSRHHDQDAARRIDDGAERDAATRTAMLAIVPNLRAFAISLCGSVDRADDLVQETLVRALANLHTFRPGSNLPAWLFTILRNHYYSDYRHRRHEVADIDAVHADALAAPPHQADRLEVADLLAALRTLPGEQREALLLVAASGFSYGHAAEITGCSIGTVKSRVHRARARLATLLSIESTDDIGPDRTSRAVVAVGGRR